MTNLAMTNHLFLCNKLASHYHSSVLGIDNTFHRVILFLLVRLLGQQLHSLIEAVAGPVGQADEGLVLNNLQTD